MFGCHSLSPVSTRIIQHTPGNESLICLGGKRGSTQEASIISPQSFWGTNHLKLKVVLSGRCQVSPNNRLHSLSDLYYRGDSQAATEWMWHSRCLCHQSALLPPLTCTAILASGIFFFFFSFKALPSKVPLKAKIIFIQARKPNFTANQQTYNHSSKQQRIIVRFDFSLLLWGPVQVVWPVIPTDHQLKIKVCEFSQAAVGLSESEEVRKSLQAKELWSVMSLFASVQASPSRCIITKMWVRVGRNRHTLMWGGHW